MWNQADYTPGIPIYLQIIEKIKAKIISGEWRAGDRVPPVRELSLSFGVNPNTMQRSLSELEREGLLYSERTAGRFVTADENRIAALQREAAGLSVARCIDYLKGLGLGEEEIRAFFEEGLHS